jgi:hypothetical protein
MQVTFFSFSLHGAVDPCSGGRLGTLPDSMRPDPIPWETGRKSQETQWALRCTTSLEGGRIASVVARPYR